MFSYSLISRESCYVNEILLSLTVSNCPYVPFQGKYTPTGQITTLISTEMCGCGHFPLKEQMSTSIVLSHRGICTKAASVVSVTGKDIAST